MKRENEKALDNYPSTLQLFDKFNNRKCTLYHIQCSLSHTRTHTHTQRNTRIVS